VLRPAGALALALDEVQHRYQPEETQSRESGICAGGSLTSEDGHSSQGSVSQWYLSEGKFMIYDCLGAWYFAYVTGLGVGVQTIKDSCNTNVT